MGNMKQRYAIVILFALIIASTMTSLGSYRTTRRMVNEDMDRALAITMQEQQSDVISQDTIRTFNSHLQIAELRGKATLAVDAHSRQFKAYARCSEATIFSLSDQRPAALLWMLTMLWAALLWHRRRQRLSQVHVGAAVNSFGGLSQVPVGAAVNSFDGLSQVPVTAAANSFGGLTFLEAERRFYAEDGDEVQLTPMQHQLMEMFFQSPAHSLTKAEICAALWPGKPDASETLYTLIKRLKPVVEQHSSLRIESDRSRAYRLKVR